MVKPPDDMPWSIVWVIGWLAACAFALPLAVAWFVSPWALLSAAILWPMAWECPLFPWSHFR